MRGTIESLRANKMACDTKDILGPTAQREYETKIKPLIDLGRDLKAMESEEELKKIKCFVRKLFPGQMLYSFMNDAKKIIEKSKDTNELLMIIFDSICDRKIDLSRIPPSEEKEINKNSAPSELIRINALLSKNNPQPIGITYCSNLLFTKSYNPNNCNLHASIIVGRKFINGQCQVLVRNTWGKKCEFDNDGRKESYQYPCDINGQIWVPQKDLMQGTFKMTWLKN